MCRPGQHLSVGEPRGHCKFYLLHNQVRLSLEAFASMQKMGSLILSPPLTFVRVSMSEDISSISPQISANNVACDVGANSDSVMHVQNLIKRIRKQCLYIFSS